jgi:hypothetical protein
VAGDDDGGGLGERQRQAADLARQRARADLVVEAGAGGEEGQGLFLGEDLDRNRIAQGGYGRLGTGDHDLGIADRRNVGRDRVGVGDVGEDDQAAVAVGLQTVADLEAQILQGLARLIWTLPSPSWTPWLPVTSTRSALSSCRL